GNSNGYPSLSTHNTITYDDNGNMITHKDKGIASIEYNFLNLPDKINGMPGKFTKTTFYNYRADGVKVSKSYYQGNSVKSTIYLDGFQYVTSPSTVLVAGLQFVPTSEGYFDFEKNLYIYNYTDHLGNIRLSYADSNHDGGILPRDMNSQYCEDMGDGNMACYDVWMPGEVVEVNNYYPFGLMHNYTVTTMNSYQMKYNGKELQETGMYDYGARFYMPDIGRWGVVDPLAELMTRHSPYNYAFNNPVIFIDPDGRAPLTDYTVNKKTGQTKQVGETNDDPDRIVKSDKEGNAVLDKKGNVKVEVDNIAKGILKDGQNFKTSDNVIDVGGKGQPTLAQAKDFAIKLSNYVGTEISGAFLSQDSSKDAAISKFYIDKYKNNTYSKSYPSLHQCYSGNNPSLNNFFTITDYHVHPTMGYDRRTIESASRSDIDFKNDINNKKMFYNFIILTQEANYPYGVQEIDYTND
ncbi:RHS repeat-associated core domain-containing protein, partial [Chryseobacterium sp. CY350]